MQRLTVRRPTRRRRERGEDGATLVEFAIAIPLFAILLFALIDSGLAFGGFLTLRNGVDAGARMATVSQYDPSCNSATNKMVCTIEDRIGSFIGVSGGSVKVSIAFPDGSSASGNDVEVCAEATLHSTTGLTPFISGRVVHATSLVRLEQDASYSAYTAAGLPC